MSQNNVIGIVYIKGMTYPAFSVATIYPTAQSFVFAMYSSTASINSGTLTINANNSNWIFPGGNWDILEIY